MKHFVYDANGVLLSETDVVVDVAPLDAVGVSATLNAVLGLWTLEDAANAVGLTPADLIAEAEAWAAGQSLLAG
jgi:hypothetical protein